jgi:hypothetical protein
MSTLFSKTDPLVEEMKAIKARVNEEAAAKFYDDKWRRDVAQEITDGIEQGFETNNIIDLFSETLNLELDGRFVIEELRGLQAFWHGRGGYIEESDLWKDAYEILPDTIGFHVTQSEDRLRTNFAETAETLVRLGTKRVIAEINNRVLAVYQAAIQSGDDSYIGAGSLSLANLNSALAGVRDASENSNPVIIGRSTMTEKIIDLLTVGNTYQMFTPETNESILATGVRGVYRGAQVITLNNYTDADGNSTFPANEIFVLDRSAGKTAFFGGPQFKEYLEPNNWNWHYIARWDVASTLIYKDRVRRIVVGDVAP